MVERLFLFIGIKMINNRDPVIIPMPMIGPTWVRSFSLSFTPFPIGSYFNQTNRTYAGMRHCWLRDVVVKSPPRHVRPTQMTSLKVKGEGWGLNSFIGPGTVERLPVIKSLIEEVSMRCYCPALTINQLLKYH